MSSTPTVPTLSTRELLRTAPWRLPSCPMTGGFSGGTDDVRLRRMTGFRVTPLREATWPEFAELVERHNGVWSGCWCMSFHPEGIGRGKTAAQNRCEKEARVREGRAHAALVFDETTCVGWCQFGPTEELPRIKNRRT